MIDLRALFIVILMAGLGVAGCDPVEPGTSSSSAARSEPSSVDDSGIELEISTRFLHEKYRFSFLDVGASVIDGRVLLTGTVETGSERDAAVDTVREIAGVREVINEIRITPRGHLMDPSRDVALERNIERRLSRIAGARTRNYRWRSVNGVVYMIGIAQDRRELERVVSQVRKVTGSRRVVSHVRVQ